MEDIFNRKEPYMMSINRKDHTKVYSMFDVSGKCGELVGVLMYDEIKWQAMIDWKRGIEVIGGDRNGSDRGL